MSLPKSDKRPVKRKTPFETFSVRTTTKAKFRKIAERKRWDLSEVADIAADALEVLTPEQLEMIVERREPVAAA
jgi:hypothetical protein